MRLRRSLATLLFVGLGCGLYLGSARPAVAECSGFDRWPSFTEVARGAPTLLIGTVTAGFQCRSRVNLSGHLPTESVSR